MKNTEFIVNFVILEVEESRDGVKGRKILNNSIYLGHPKTEILG